MTAPGGRWTCVPSTLDRNRTSAVSRPQASQAGQMLNTTKNGEPPRDGGCARDARGTPVMALIESPQVCSLNFLTCEQRSV